MTDLVGRTVLKRYRIDEFLGRGGMAEVYCAWDTKRSVHVALKVLNEDLAEDYVFLRRFAREAQALELLQHPHIVRFFGFEESQDLAFLMMEYIDGVTLRRQLKLLGRPLTLPEALVVLQPVCSALHYAHGMGIYHCDVKPANIFIERGGRVVLGDFGIARLSESATVTFSTPGTPAYMTPEQCRGEELDARTDIYSLGVTIYEMLTLDRPFKGDTEGTTGSRGERVRWEQLNVPPPRPGSVNPDISPAAEAAILRALEKGPERRQQGALEFYEELSEGDRVQAAVALPWVLSDEPTTIPPVSAAEPVAVPPVAEKRKVGMPPLAWGVVGAVVLLLLVAILSVALAGRDGKDDVDEVATLVVQLTAGARMATAEVALRPTNTPLPSVNTPTLTPTAVRPTQAPTNTPEPTVTPLPVPTDTPRPTHTPVPPTPVGLVVEDAEGYTSDAALNASYNINCAWGANEGSLSLAGPPHIGGGSRAIAFWFDILNPAPDHYCGFERHFPGASQNWSGYSQLCLWVENESSGRDLLVHFGEVSGEVWKHVTALTTLGAGELCLPLSKDTVGELDF